MPIRGREHAGPDTLCDREMQGIERAQRVIE